MVKVEILSCIKKKKKKIVAKLYLFCFALLEILQNKGLGVEMAIFARPAGTRPGPTLMGWILLSLIRNRVGYGFFFFKKKPEAGPGQVRVL